MGSEERVALRTRSAGGATKVRLCLPPARACAAKGGTLLQRGWGGFYRPADCLSTLSQGEQSGVRGHTAGLVTGVLGRERGQAHGSSWSFAASGTAGL